MGKVPCIAFEVRFRRGVAVTDGWTDGDRKRLRGEGVTRMEREEGERKREGDMVSVECACLCVCQLSERWSSSMEE